jgi:hypothetical protein
MHDPRVLQDMSDAFSDTVDSWFSSLYTFWLWVDEYDLVQWWWFPVLMCLLFIVLDFFRSVVVWVQHPRVSVLLEAVLDGWTFLTFLWLASFVVMCGEIGAFAREVAFTSRVLDDVAGCDPVPGRAGLTAVAVSYIRAGLTAVAVSYIHRVFRDHIVLVPRAGATMHRGTAPVPGRVRRPLRPALGVA